MYIILTHLVYIVKKRLILCFSLFAIPILLFGQSFDDSVGALIREKNIEALNSFFLENSQSDDYPALENFVIESAKNLIVQGEYKFAQELLKVVLTNNLENSEAQELYTSLESTIQEKLRIDEEVRKKEEVRKQKEDEEQRQRELALQQAEEERQRKEELKAEEERLKVEEEANIEAEKQRMEEITIIGSENFSFSLNLAPVNIVLYHSDYYDDYYNTVKVNLKYGLGLDLAAFFRHPFVRTGIDITFDTAFVNILNSNGTPFAYNIYISGTSPVIRIPLYFVTGFSHLFYSFGLDYSQEDIDVRTISYPSPVAGLRFGNIHFSPGVFGIDFTSLYHLASLRKNQEGDESAAILEYDAVFDVTARLILRPRKTNRLNLSYGARLGALFIVSDGNWEINGKILFNIGAKFYGK